MAEIPLRAPFLADRPLKMDWHRVYQDYTERTRPDFDLAAEYKLLAEQHPDNSGLLYLYARTLQDSNKKLAILKQACEVDGEVSRYAYHGRAYELATRGRFDEAIAYSQKAYGDSDRSPTFTDLYLNCLQATGNWRDAINVVNETQSKSNDRIESRYLRLSTLLNSIPLWAGMESEPSFIDSQIDDFIADIRADSMFSLDYLLSVQESMEFSRNYALGELDEIFVHETDSNDEESNAEEPNGEIPFWQLVSQRKTEQAAEAASRDELAMNYAAQLQVYVIAVDAGKDDIAQTHLATAVQALRQGGRDEQLLADIFENGDRSEIYHPVARSQDARVIALALSRRFPKLQNEYEKLAMKLNFERTVPYWFIRATIEGDR